MKVGDKVFIAPDLTRLPDWVEGHVIEIEDNSYIGTVISAETADNNVFFGQEDMFKQKSEEVCTQ